MGKVIRDEDLRLNVIVNGDSGRKKILDLEKAVDASTASIRQMRKEQEMLAKQGQTDTARYKELSAAIKAETASVKQNKAEIEALRRQMSVNSMTIAELTNRAKQLRAQLANMAPGTAEWERVNKQLQETNSRLAELRGQSGRAGTSMGALTGGIAKFAAGVGAALLVLRRAWSVIREGAQTIGDFEQANVDLAAILGKNVEDISLLTDEALRLGAATKYTATQATGLQIELAKLGFTEREIIAMGEPVLNFATAIGADLSEAAALSGAALRMFGLQAEDTEDVLATLTLSTNKSALSFNYYQTALATVGPVAKTFGLGVKDTAALLGTLANAGFDASSAATATRNIILNLANANGKLAKALGEPVRTFPELMDGLKRLNAQGIDLATTLELTDKRSVAAFNTFLAGADSAITLRSELENTSGVLEDIAEKKMNTAEGAMTSLKSAWERFTLSLRENTGFVKDAVLALRDFIQSITPEENRASADEVAGRTADYVRSLWEMYGVELAEGEEARKEALDKISQAIIEDQAKIEQQLASAEAKLASTSGSRNRKRWKAEVDRLRDAAYVMRGANQEFLDRQMWFLGGQDSYYSGGSGGAGGDSGDGGDGGDNGKKKKSTRSLQSDEAFLAAKAELTRKYNEQEIATKEEYDQQLYELEVASLTARLAAGKEKGADRLKLENELLEKIAKHQEDAQKDAAKKEEQLAKDKAQLLADMETDAIMKARIQEDARYAEERKKYEGNAEMLELIDKKHLLNLAKIETDAQNQKMSAMQRAHELERAERENYWLDRIAHVKKGSAEEKELRKQMNQELGALDLEYLNSLHTLLEHIVETGEFEGIAIPEEQLDAFKKKLQEVIKEITETSAALAGESDGGFWSGTGNGNLFGVSQAQWDQFFSNLSKGKLDAMDLGNAITAMGGLAQQGFAIANQAIAMTNAKEQQELKAYKKANDEKQKALQERLDAGLITQAQYESEIEKMRLEQEEREEQQEIRQAERQKRMNIAQAIIQTSLAVMKTFTEWGGWPTGVAPAAIMGALGAAQVALMASTPVTGREGGGAFDDRPVRVRRKQDGRTFPAHLSPDQRGWINRPTVLVGENGSEYVIPADALQNPSVRPFVDAIETARRSGRLRDLRLEAVQPRAAVAGRYAGGFFADDTDGLGGTAFPDGVRLSAANSQELLQALRTLNTILSVPIRAEVAMLGRKGILEKTEEYNRAKKGGSLNG